MSSSGNQFFSRVENNVLAPSALNSQHVSGKLSSLKEISGTCVPTAIGSYAIVDALGNPVVLQANSSVIATFLGSDLPLTSGGAATVTFGLSTLAGTAPLAFTFLPAPVAFGLVNQGVSSPANSGNPFVGVMQQYLTVTVAGAAVTGGVLRVTVLTF